jgi:hypothetical protein
MKHLDMIFLAIVVVLLMPSASKAQIGPSNPGDVAVIGPFPDPSAIGCNASQARCVDAGVGIPLSYFANAAQVNGLLQRSLQLTAISAAMGDAIPNSGDRFAFRAHLAASSGQGAGAMGISYNFTDNARASLNYGQSQRQSVVSAGVNWSFH